MLFALLFLVIAGNSHAAEIIVTSSADDNGSGCTLREAIANADNDSDNGGNGCVAGSGVDNITFEQAGTIIVNEALVTNSSLSIDGDLDDDGIPDIKITSSDTSEICAALAMRK